MADEKKPKIDLKARLGKMGATQPGMAVPPGRPSSPSSIPAPPMATAMPGQAIPAPPGIPVGAPSPFAPAQSTPAIDPSNPLAAVAVPYRTAPPPPPPQPQRIEVDESAVEEARAGARKQGFIVAAIAAVAFLGVGYVVGGASEQKSGRTKGARDATELAVDVAKARDTLKTMSEKLDAGRDQIKNRKFPDALAKDLGGLNVDFDGSKLAGRRFSGFPQETTSSLVEFITSVQAINDRKIVVANLLTKLQKPISEQLNAPSGQQSIGQVVVLDKDPAGNPAAFLASLITPIKATADKTDLPDDFNFVKPGGGGNAKAPRYKGGDASTHATALYVVPKSFEGVCPTETAGQLAQLSAQIGNFAREIKGEGAAGGDAVTDTKAGLLERADKLVTALQKVGGAS